MLWPHQAPAHPTAAPPPSTSLQYQSPLPGARYVSPSCNIIIRPGGVIDGSSRLDGSIFTVQGTISGLHEGRADLSDDQRTVTFEPFVPYAPSERVSCRLERDLRTADLGDVAPFNFEFTIADPPGATLPGPAAYSDLDPPLDAPDVSAIPPVPPSPSAPEAGIARADTLPPDFPFLQQTVRGTPSPGRLFLSNVSLSMPIPSSYLLIVKDDGTPVFHRRVNGFVLDFKLQPDGRLTYFDSSVQCFYAMDASYAIVDSFRCGNGYPTDGHELRILPNGHALLMSYDIQAVDMSQFVPGGHTSAAVAGLIIQEIDRAKRVVFQWRSWDHFKFTDATHLNLTAPSLDYVHGNAIELDRDGNLLISSRHMDEITKISRETGEILWRLGGRNNQFRFTNDPIGFSRQHHIRRLPSGTITLFDNGNFHLPPFSRAVEYRLDEKKKTATLVWQFRRTPDTFGFALGSVQRLPTGNTLIGWGATNPSVTEVTPAGATVSELTFAPRVSSYRAFRHEWPPVIEAAVDLRPKVLKLPSQTPWVSVTINLRGFDPSRIDLSTVRLAGSVPPDLKSAPISDHDSRGGCDLHLKFSRRSLEPLLVEGPNVLEVRGSLISGEVFRGYGEIRVTRTGRPRPDALPVTLVSASGARPLEFQVAGTGGGGCAIGVFDLQGRLVKRWTAASGTGSVTWDGRRNDGHRVASGIYFISAEAAGRRGTLKVLIAR